MSKLSISEIIERINGSIQPSNDEDEDRLESLRNLKIIVSCLIDEILDLRRHKTSNNVYLREFAEEASVFKLVLEDTLKNRPH